MASIQTKKRPHFSHQSSQNHPPRAPHLTPFTPITSFFYMSHCSLLISTIFFSLVFFHKFFDCKYCINQILPQYSSNNHISHHHIVHLAQRYHFEKISGSFFQNLISSNISYHYWCQQAGLDPSCIASMTSHLVDRDNAILRLEFMTESQRITFTQHCKGLKCEWKINHQRHKMRTEPDITASDRISKKPFYALLEKLRDIFPVSEKGWNGELDADINTLQIYPFRIATKRSILAQVSYVLDSRFARGYVCLIFVIENFLEEKQQKWLEPFSNKMMRPCLNIIQPLSRAAQHSTTTTTRYHHSKALDISNILQPVYLQTTHHFHYKELRAFQENSTMFSRSTTFSMTHQQELPDPDPITKLRTKAQVRVSTKARIQHNKAFWTTTTNGTDNLHNKKATTQTDLQTKPNMAEIGMTTRTPQAHKGCHPLPLHNLQTSRHTPKQQLPHPSRMHTTPDTNFPPHLPLQPMTIFFAFDAIALKDPTKTAQIVIQIHYHQVSTTRSHKSLLRLVTLEFTPTMTLVRPSLAMENVNYANTTRTLPNLRRSSIRQSCPCCLAIGLLPTFIRPLPGQGLRVLPQHFKATISISQQQHFTA